MSLALGGHPASKSLHRLLLMECTFSSTPLLHGHVPLADSNLCDRVILNYMVYSSQCEILGLKSSSVRFKDIWNMVTWCYRGCMERESPQETGLIHKKLCLYDVIAVCSSGPKNMSSVCVCVLSL